MTGFDYGRMQATATRLLTKFAQGTVVLRRVTQAAGPNAWTPGSETVTDYTLKATVKRVHRRYIGGALVQETGDEVMFAITSVDPELTDRLVIDGEERAITELTPMPGAGVVVAWKAWCAA